MTDERWQPDSPKKGKDYLTRKLLAGEFYSTGAFFSSVGANNSKKIVLTNPESNERKIGVIFTVSVEGKSRIDKRQNVTIDTEGEQLDQLNKAGTYSNGSTIDVQLGGDNETGIFSGGTAFNPKHIGAGKDQKTASPGSSGNGISNIVPPGENISIEVTNKLSETIEASIDVDFVYIEPYEALNT